MNEYRARVIHGNAGVIHGNTDIVYGNASVAHGNGAAVRPGMMALARPASWPSRGIAPSLVPASPIAVRTWLWAMRPQRRAARRVEDLRPFAPRHAVASASLAGHRHRFEALSAQPETPGAPTVDVARLWLTVDRRGRTASR